MAIFGHSVLSLTDDFSELLYICDKASESIIWPLTRWPELAKGSVIYQCHHSPTFILGSFRISSQELIDTGDNRNGIVENFGV